MHMHQQALEHPRVHLESPQSSEEKEKLSWCFSFNVSRTVTWTRETWSWTLYCPPVDSEWSVSSILGPPIVYLSKIRWWCWSCVWPHGHAWIGRREVGWAHSPEERHCWHLLWRTRLPIPTAWGSAHLEVQNLLHCVLLRPASRICGWWTAFTHI